MYIQVTTTIHEVDGRAYVQSWLAIPDNPSRIEGIFFHTEVVPADFYKHPDWYYIEEGQLRRNKYRTY